MFDVRANNFENRCIIVLKGKLELTEIKQAAEKINNAIKNMKPGFTVITDIRELATLAEDVRLVVINIMQAMNYAGMGVEVRVVNPQNLVIARQLQITSRTVGYTAQEATSVNAAEQIVDWLVSS